MGLFEKKEKEWRDKKMSMKYDFTTILDREGTGAIAVSKIPFDNAEIKEYEIDYKNGEGRIITNICLYDEYIYSVEEIVADG